MDFRLSGVRPVEIGGEPACCGFLAFWLADLDERACCAFGFFVAGGRSCAGVKDLHRAGGCADGQLPEICIEGDLGPAVGLPVVEICERDSRQRKHFLEADRLGANLNLIRTVALRFSPLVFHWNHPSVVMEFDDVALAAEPVSHRGYGNPANSPDIAARFRRPLVRTLVEYASLGSQAVLAPLSFEVDERKLPLAEEGML